MVQSAWRMAGDGGRRSDVGRQRTEGTPVKHPKGTRFNGVGRTDGRKGMNSLAVRDEWMIRMVGWKDLRSDVGRQRTEDGC